MGCIARVVGTAPSRAQSIVGRAAAIDGTALMVDGRPVSLAGIAAPDADSVDGFLAVLMMQLIVRGQLVQCEPTGRRSADRIVAFCYREDGEDIGQLMVHLGHARDCPSRSKGRYAAVETAARAEGRDLSKDFALPEDCAPPA